MTDQQQEKRERRVYFDPGLVNFAYVVTEGKTIIKADIVKVIPQDYAHFKANTIEALASTEGSIRNMATQIQMDYNPELWVCERQRKAKQYLPELAGMLYSNWAYCDMYMPFAGYMPYQSKFKFVDTKTACKTVGIKWKQKDKPKGKRLTKSQRRTMKKRVSREKVKEWVDKLGLKGINKEEWFKGKNQHIVDCMVLWIADLLDDESINKTL